MSKRVLVVEDDAGLRETLRLLLELDGYAVVTAVDGLDGLDWFSEAPPDIVLLDLMMPRLDGYQFAAALEQRGQRHLAPLIVLTADGRAREKALRVGADGWLEKPFDVLDLLGVVARLTGQR